MLRFIFGLAAIFILAGCERQSGDAIVLTKEHIDAAIAAETPSGSHDASPAEIANGEETLRPMRDDEIAVDQYVMTPEVRGTSRDPRALKDEQWIVKVRVVSDGRTFNVQTDRAQFGNLKEGDRVHVSYRVGKYTSTVWSAEIRSSDK